MVCYTATYKGSQICTELNGVFDLGLDKKYYLPKELNKLMIPYNNFTVEKSSLDFIPMTLSSEYELPYILFLEVLF